MIRKNMKLIIGLMIGIILPSMFAYAANSLSANSISIDKTNMSKVPQENLQSALDYLYSQSEKNNLITIESGVLHKSQTYLGVAYLDPTNLENKCTAQNSVSETGTKTGCMKWYIYKDLGDSYKMILDHNTTEKIAWNTTGNDGNGTNVAFGPNETGDESYDNLVYKELMLLKSLDIVNGGSGWKVKEGNESETGKIRELDIISAEEIADIVGYKALNNNKNWTNTSGWFCLATAKSSNLYSNCAKEQGVSKYAWLTSAPYWTKTTRGNAGSGYQVWLVGESKDLSYTYASNALHGVRPVITVSKNLFNN